MYDNALAVVEVKANLERMLKVQDKLDTLKDGYYKIVHEQGIEQTEELLSQLDGEIRKIEASL